MADPDRVRRSMDKGGLDALVAFARENVYYLSGFQTSDPKDFAAVVFPIDGEPVLLASKTDEYYIEEEWRTSRTRFFGKFYVEGAMTSFGEFDDSADGMGKILAQHGLKRVGFDERGVSLDFHDRLEARYPAIEFRKASTIFDELRMIKSEDEIRRITNALRVTETALMNTYDSVREGMTEADVANEMRIALANEKADCTWVEMGGAAGAGTYPNPKHVIKKGEILHIDVGAIYEGYACDTSRDAVLGKPNHRQSKVNETVTDALEKAIEEIRPAQGFPTYSIQARKL